MINLKKYTFIILVIFLAAIFALIIPRSASATHLQFSCVSFEHAVSDCSDSSISRSEFCRSTDLNEACVLDSGTGTFFNTACTDCGALGKACDDTTHGCSLTGPPIVTTLDATNVTSLDAILNGSVNPNSSNTTAWFRYGTINPGTCNNSFGFHSLPLEGAAISLGSGDTLYSTSITSLSPSTTYYFCAIAINFVGMGFGTIRQFTTSPFSVPTVTTLPATFTTQPGFSCVWAGLGGTVNPNGLDTTAWLRYDTTNPGTCNDAFGTRSPPRLDGQLFGTSPVEWGIGWPTFIAGTTYYFCVIAENSLGKSFGTVLSFAIPLDDCIPSTCFLPDVCKANNADCNNIGGSVDASKSCTSSQVCCVLPAPTGAPTPTSTGIPPTPTSTPIPTIIPPPTPPLLLIFGEKLSV